MMHKPDSQLLSEIELFFGSSGLLDTLASFVKALPRKRGQGLRPLVLAP